MVMTWLVYTDHRQSVYITTVEEWIFFIPTGYLNSSSKLNNQAISIYLVLDTYHFNSLKVLVFYLEIFLSAV